MFDAIVQPVTMSELIAGGYLTPFTMIRPPEKLKNDEIAIKPVDAYLEHAAGRQAICFALHIKAATEFRDQFVVMGVEAEIITGAMKTGERRAILERFKEGKTAVLVNCGVLTEGFDHPATSCVIIARSVGPLALWLQMLGRGLRCCEGKKDAILLDLNGSWHDHGDPDAAREWFLEGDAVGGKKVEAPPERFCKVCGIVIESTWVGPCPGCGVEVSQALPPTVVNVPLVKYAKKMAEGEDKRVATLTKWLREARDANHKPGRAMHKYRVVYGAWPPRNIVVAATDLVRLDSVTTVR